MPTRGLSYHRLARREVRDAIKWIARERRSGAIQFREELQRAHQAIETAAESYPVEYRDVRWLRLGKFKYVVRFLILDDSHCRIIAVSHTSRRPRYWLGRLKRP
ncbi:MAG TPA: type II toxin-antitoxin system RelE/ParE family toxin [Gemmataceae bacterium]|jgi:plasmid stabilization system protein ParE